MKCILDIFENIWFFCLFFFCFAFTISPNTYKFKELSEKCLPEHEKLFCGHLLTIHPTSYQYLIKAYLSPLRPGKPDATR